MKKLLLFVIGVLSVSCGFAYNQVRLVINDGIYDTALKKQMEQAVSAVMTEINRSQEQNISHLVFSATYMDAGAQAELNQLWKNDRMRCVEEEIVERILTTYTGFQVRGIPLIVKSAEGGEELGYQEAVINFDKNGIITSFYYTINPELYSKLRMTQSQDRRYEVTDIKDRMMILDYVEHFRTSYNQKDLKFLRQVFSDDALIITGKVVKVRKSEVVPTGNKVIYTTQTKQQYLDNLAKAFKANSYIKVAFDDVAIVEHPTIHGIYGVTVHQKWNTARYSDEGYVFMVWDFRHPDAPQIHVRTWQPEYVDKTHGQRLNPNDVFTLGDFDL
ncbi:MAG: nuclear transport factor 2 family protein [Prevotella sp.]|nr:nuclear transport factor 2 family protein [Prevotella sp.]MBO6187050.1 nuclear transport factor 2 family protein [Prevotella sp.]